MTFRAVECERCGRPLVTANRSIHGNDRLKAEFGILCQDCTTPEEADRLLKAMAGSILQKCTK